LAKWSKSFSAFPVILLFKCYIAVTVIPHAKIADYERFAVPLADKDSAISEHFAKALFIALWERKVSDGTASDPEVLDNRFSDIEKGKGMRLAEFLVERGVDLLYTKEDFKGKGPEHVFSGAEVEVRKTDKTTLNELMISEQ